MATRVVRTLRTALRLAEVMQKLGCAREPGEAGAGSAPPAAGPGAVPAAAPQSILRASTTEVQAGASGPGRWGTRQQERIRMGCLRGSLLASKGPGQNGVLSSNLGNAKSFRSPWMLRAWATRMTISRAWKRAFPVRVLKCTSAAEGSVMISPKTPFYINEFN